MSHVFLVGVRKIYIAGNFEEYGSEPRRVEVVLSSSIQSECRKIALALLGHILWVGYYGIIFFFRLYKYSPQAFSQQRLTPDRQRLLGLAMLFNVGR